MKLLVVRGDGSIYNILLFHKWKKEQIELVRVAITLPVIENIYKFQPTVTNAATRNVGITPTRGEVNTGMLCPATKE